MRQRISSAAIFSDSLSSLFTFFLLRLSWLIYGHVSRSVILSDIFPKGDSAMRSIRNKTERQHVCSQDEKARQLLDKRRGRWKQRYPNDNARLRFSGTVEEANVCSPNFSRNRFLTILGVVFSIVMAVVRPCYSIPYFPHSPCSMKGVSAMLSIKKTETERHRLLSQDDQKRLLPR